MSVNTLTQPGSRYSDFRQRKFEETLCRKLNAINTGWITVRESWVYTSAGGPDYNVTVPKGAADRFSVLNKVKFNQEGVTYYGLITNVTDTALKISVHPDGTAPADAVISHIAVSFAGRPLGWPSTGFSFTPSWVTSAPAPDIGDGTLTGLYWVSSQELVCKVTLIVGSTTTFGSGDWSFYGPIFQFGGTEVGIPGVGHTVISGTSYPTILRLTGTTGFYVMYSSGWTTEFSNVYPPMNNGDVLIINYRLLYT